MADFKKILEHPEFQTVVDKLLMGDSAKDVSYYLKLKYDKPDENHLRLSVSLLEEFVAKYLNTSKFMDKLVKDSTSNSLDKAISESLLNNKTWKQRIAEITDEKIDLNKKLAEQLTILEQRQEQIFDKIQENPGNTKLDYVFTKYFEIHGQLIDRIDKIVNKSPDQRIEHTYSVQMINEHSNTIQEAVRRVIARLPDNLASEFMQMLNEELSSIKPINIHEPKFTPKVALKEIDKFDKGIEKVDKLLGTIEDED